jgi:hypothetical protein
MKQVHIEEALRTGWRGMQNNFGSFLALLGLYVVVMVVEHLLASGGLLVSLLGHVVNVVFSLILTKFGLQVAEMNGEKAASFGNLELGGRTVLQFLLTQWLVLFLVAAGLALIWAPVGVFVALTVGLAALKGMGPDVWKTLGLGLGLVALAGLASVAAVVYFAVTFSFAALACLHQNLGPVDAIKESRRLVAGAFTGVGLLSLVFIGVVLLGLLCLLVGVIPAVMVLAVAHSTVYLSLLEQSGPRPADA